MVSFATYKLIARIGMFATIASPEKIASEELDQLLAKGWYRMGQNVFTTHFLCFDHHFYSALWLRVGLSEAIEDVKFKQLKKQNRQFSIEVKKAEVTLQHEELYKNYRQSVLFEPSETLHMLLYGYSTASRFNTYEINIYDGPVLVAAGFFDLGKNSAAGIVSFYHPAYKKYSPGKYIIYSKMDFCRQHNIAYFYPGYVVPGYPPFEYKASIGKETLEYYSVMTQQWLLFKSFSDDADPLKLMRNKLDTLQKMLVKKRIFSKMLYYRFFDANLDPYYSTDKLLDFPVFLYCQPLMNDDHFNLIVYDVSNANYSLLKCSAVIKIGWQKSIEEVFSSHLLRVDVVLLSTKFLEELVRKVITIPGY